MAEALARALDVDAVLFDLDGTLADTAGDLAGAVNRVRRERGLVPVPVAAMRRYASAGARGLLVRRHGRHAGGRRVPGASRRVPAALREPACRKRRGCSRASRRLLDTLEARGLAWGIVTNKACAVHESGGGRAQARHAAPGRSSSGDTTPHPKPHPEPLLHAARALDVPPARCVYVGDDLRDVQAGIAAGMPTLVARWGYLGTGEPHENWPATGGADRPLDVLDWLPAKRSR